MRKLWEIGGEIRERGYGKLGEFPFDG